MPSRTRTRSADRAGNKSMLAYRSDIGIPGYTGYCPGWSTVPVPINGSNKHTGRLPLDSTDPVVDQEATLKSDQRHAASEYRSTYQPADPAAYKAPNRTGGGYWFEDRQRAAAGNSVPFSSSTTYAAEMLQGEATVQQQRQQVEGLPSTLVAYQTARQHRTQSADPSLTRTGGALSSTTAATSSGQLIGYRTTYSSTNRPLEVKREATMMMQQQQAAAASGAGDSQRPASCPAGGVERLRMAVMPTVTNCKRFEGSSTYARDFGPLGADPMRHMLSTLPSQQTPSSTTRELSEGTTRATAQHPPGYTGFIPAASTNPVAMEQGAGTVARPDAKQAMLPATLQQFARGCCSGYTGYKPKEGSAAVAVLPAQGPTAETAETTSGFVNLQVSERGPQRVDHRHCINSRAGLMSFFTGGGESVSDNGLADAQRYWVGGRRPCGGRMKHV